MINEDSTHETNKRSFEIISTCRSLFKRDKTKVTLMFLWEAYKEQYGSDAYEYTQFRVYYRCYKQKLTPPMRQIHIAGEKVFVDYSGVTVYSGEDEP